LGSAVGHFQLTSSLLTSDLCLSGSLSAVNQRLLTNGNPLKHRPCGTRRECHSAETMYCSSFPSGIA
jgi:hypothetical protein